ncbi:unnamed protein product [Prorocentrum cordatum]|uniref:Uncharacterized protein n=1 Tax=Prorocentrum cordatum TaxID=2364126 RepID=A0ABN9SML8_9DINO|nr:unnamed protein product [Polarella glacialis]CAK0833089.1 unnamed protein product [Polarella glacialis]
MAPKKRKGAAPVKAPLPAYSIAAQDLERAKQLLSNEEELKRQRSNLSYWLDSVGAKDAYSAKGTEEKKAFLTQWFADKLVKLEGQNKLSTIRTAGTLKKKEEDFEWMSKETMIARLGARKAQSKIDSNTLNHRPDPDTKLDGEFDREYKVFFSKGGESEYHDDKKDLSNEQALDTEQAAKEAKDHFDSIVANTAGSSASGGAVAPGPEASVPPVTIKSEFGEFQHTVDAFKKDPRKVCSTTASMLTDLKKIWTECKNNKYATAVHEDAQKLIPKVKQVHGIMEGMIVQSNMQDDHILAMAQKLDPLFTQFNDLNEWYTRISGAPPKAKKVRKL